jgi:hypothetical protein
LKNFRTPELVSESVFHGVTWFGIQTYAWNSTVAMMYIDWSVIRYWRKYFLSVPFIWMWMCCRWLNVYCDIFNTLVFCYLQCTTSWNNHVLFSIILNKQNLLTLICFVCLCIDALFFSFRYWICVIMHFKSLKTQNEG